MSYSTEPLRRNDEAAAALLSRRKRVARGGSPRCVGYAAKGRFNLHQILRWARGMSGLPPRIRFKDAELCVQGRPGVGETSGPRSRALFELNEAGFGGG